MGPHSGFPAIPAGGASAGTLRIAGSFAPDHSAKAMGLSKAEVERAANGAPKPGHKPVITALPHALGY